MGVVPLFVVPGIVATSYVTFLGISKTKLGTAARGTGGRTFAVVRKPPPIGGAVRMPLPQCALAAARPMVASLQQRAIYYQKSDG